MTGPQHGTNCLGDPGGSLEATLEATVYRRGTAMPMGSGPLKPARLRVKVADRRSKARPDLSQAGVRTHSANPLLAMRRDVSIHSVDVEIPRTLPAFGIQRHLS
jgi:hypothetical protein